MTIFQISWLSVLSRLSPCGFLRKSWRLYWRNRSFLLLIALSGLMGCTTAERRVTVYPEIKPNLIVVETTSEDINEVCRQYKDGRYVESQKWDDGREIQRHETIAACYLPWANTIYIPKGAMGCLWRHELGHAAGLSKDVVNAFKCD